MDRNEHGIVIDPELGQEINTAMLRGDTGSLLRLIGSYLSDNDFSISDAAISLIRSKKLN